MLLQEDIKDGDHTSLACIPPNAIGKAQLLVKEKGILAGMEVAEAIFNKVNSNIQFFPLMNDGEQMTVGDIAFVVEGPSSSLLTAERLVLNVMQRMSAVATKTRHITKLLKGTKAKVLDTPKNNAWHSVFGKMGRENRRWHKPPFWSVRHDDDKRQSH